MSNKEQQPAQAGKTPQASQANSAEQNNEQTDGPGKQLAKTRAAMGLSQQEIADRLHLRITSIQAVESDVPEAGVSVTFTKGYVRLYAKLVNMDAEPLLLAYDKLHAKENQPAKLQSFSRRVSREAHDHRWNMVSMVVVLLVLGSVVVWWVEREGYLTDSGKNISEAIDSLISSEDEENQDVQTDLIAVSTDNIVKQDAGPEILEEDVVNLAGQEQNPELDADDVANSQISLADDNTDDSQASLEDAADNVQNAIEDASINAQQTANTVTAELTPEPQSEESSNQVSSGGREVIPSRGDIVEGVFTEEGYRLNADGTVDVAFTFLEDCWVSVKDGNGETMAYGVKTKGRVMTVSGVPPVRVILGAPSVVEVDFGGLKIDMSVFPGGESARFNLPIESE
jgi:cytoskeleton protein RodZ